jgi:hypothetical protein
MDESQTPYGRALLTAFEMGRADGLIAASLGIEVRTGHLRAERWRGRSPEAFAHYLWAGRADPAPSALEVNAPLWYAAGYREGLQDPSARTPLVVPHRR